MEDYTYHLRAVEHDPDVLLDRVCVATCQPVDELIQFGVVRLGGRVQLRLGPVVGVPVRGQSGQPLLLGLLMRLHDGQLLHRDRGDRGLPLLVRLLVPPCRRRDLRGVLLLAQHSRQAGCRHGGHARFRRRRDRCRSRVRGGVVRLERRTVRLDLERL